MNLICERVAYLNFSQDPIYMIFLLILERVSFYFCMPEALKLPNLNISYSKILVKKMFGSLRTLVLHFNVQNMRNVGISSKIASSCESFILNFVELHSTWGLVSRLNLLIVYKLRGLNKLLWCKFSNPKNCWNTCAQIPANDVTAHALKNCQLEATLPCSALLRALKIIVRTFLGGFFPS